jgi:hypothetical protein
MSHGSASRVRATNAAVPAALVLLALCLASCADKITTVDPGLVPEGAASTQSGLAVWREIPNHVYVYIRGNPTGDPPVPHVLIDSVTAVSPLPGQVHGVIRDSTTANAYQVYRRETNGGYTEIYDFTATAARKWFDRGWEIYHFTDADTTVPTRTYLGRGVVGGRATLGAPLTNEASDQVRAVHNINYRGATGFDSQGEASPLDSLFLMEWDAVENAVAYYIHVYQWSFNLINLDEQIASGMPAPLFIGKSRDVLVAYMPVPNPPPAPGVRVLFRMPTPTATPSDVRILTVRETRYGQEYLVRIAAVDALGQLIAYTYGNNSQELASLPDGTTLPSTQFAAYPLGAVRVVPKRCTPGTPGCP